MQVYVMLTVDLNRGVSEDARNKFNEYMKQEHWKKLKLTTTWYACFAEGVTAESAVRATKTDVQKAIAHAGISYYEAALEVGSSVPITWNQTS